MHVLMWWDRLLAALAKWGPIILPQGMKVPHLHHCCPVFDFLGCPLDWKNYRKRSFYKTREEEYQCERSV